MFSFLPAWGLKPSFYFLQTLSLWFLFHSGGQRKPRFCWQQPRVPQEPRSQESWSIFSPWVLLLAKSWLSLPIKAELKKKYAEFGGNGRMALIFRWQRGEHSRLMLQELCPHGPSLPPPHEESRGLYEGSQPGVSDKEQRCYDLSSSSCIVSKTFISKHQ